jgi:predicted metal-dependent phosphotriesterase family hydrolase
MASIRTVCGDSDPSALGACYSHEHVLCSPPPDVSDRDLELDSEATAIQELTWFKWKTGVTLSYDQISKEKYAPDARRVEFILRAVNAGFGQQIILGGDLARKSYWPGYGTGGGPGLTYLLWRFIPWLRSEGLNESVIQDLITHNPARALKMN